MPSDVCKELLEDFLQSSRGCIEALARTLTGFRGETEEKVKLFSMKGNQRNEFTLNREHFFLRTSVEYSNPQLTLEEVQGIIAARMLEVSVEHLSKYGFGKIGKKDVDELCERLKKPPSGIIFPFLLNTDDVEPDRYSINPLKESIVKSGQSAFSSAAVRAEDLEIDTRFMEKYEGKLVSRFEAEMIERHITDCGNIYMNMVDAVKYDHLEILSESFGIDLCLPTIRMPLTILANEKTSDLLHYLIKKAHMNYGSIEKLYNCMGRSMKNRTTLLTVPHSRKGFASKRAARGKMYFEDRVLKSVRVEYTTAKLYPNAIDPDDVSIAEAEDQFSVEGQKLVNYDFRETPSSPQFILYSLASPEDAALWHGIGEFGSSQLVKSYITTHLACTRDSIIDGLKNYGVRLKIPPQFNLVSKNIWFHPIYRNIDASIGCVESLEDLLEIGMKIEHLPMQEYVR